MKIIHTADWHLGKLVHGIYMTEQQREILRQFVDLVAEEQPDAVIIAGDLYDRSVPPTDAVELLDEVLFKINVEYKTPVLAISGNHDSAERLSFGSSWYRHSKMYINGRLQDCIEPVRLNGANVYLVPYAEPGEVKQWFDDSSIHSHQDAMMRVTGELERNLDHGAINILVGHAFVTGGKTSESERTLSVGGSGCVDASCFGPFAYTALGHLHSPDAIRHETVRYSGSLLKYSFSESRHNKSVSIIHFDQNGDYSLEERYLQPKQDMRELTGYLEELLDPSFHHNQKTDDFLKVTLLDEGALIDPIGKLRQVYPHVLHLERKADQADMNRKWQLASGNLEKKTEIDLFEDFYKEITAREWTEDKRKIMEEVMNSVKREAVLA
ncbi:MAG TPA: exonuclease SbcCD subunit D [Bacillaceae bacterium]